MGPIFSPPFKYSGGATLATETLFAALLVGAFWSSYPAGFARIGTVLGILLLVCWLLAFWLGAKVRASNSARLEGRARVALVVGAIFGFGGLLFGLLVGPHLAGIASVGVMAQLAILVIGRVSLAI
jgi:hypothetical protein